MELPGPGRGFCRRTPRNNERDECERAAHVPSQPFRIVCAGFVLCEICCVPTHVIIAPLSMYIHICFRHGVPRHRNQLHLHVKDRQFLLEGVHCVDLPHFGRPQVRNADPCGRCVDLPPIRRYAARVRSLFLRRGTHMVAHQRTCDTTDHVCIPPFCRGDPAVTEQRGDAKRPPA